MNNIKNYIKKEIGLLNIYSKLENNNRISNEILWSQIFNDTIRECEWLKKKSFSPGRWAVGYPALYIIYRILNDIRPNSILEFGLGESTKLTYQYIKNLNISAKLKIIEQDEEWLIFFSNGIFEVNPYIELLPIEKINIENKKSYIYNNLIPRIDCNKFDFIIIDGPWGSENNSRPQIINIVENNLLDKKFIILMDDYNRKGEKQTIEKLFKILTNKKIPYVNGIYSGMKDTAIICSEEYKFLTSL